MDIHGHVYLLFLMLACLLGNNLDCEAAENPCSYGSPLHGSYCGRGGHPCPQYHSCKIAPNDAYAVCCPDYCKAGSLPVMDGNGFPVHCGRGGMQCPDSYICRVAPTDAWAVCCPDI
ncbi:uncharacterized protein LOC132758689 [Ruditapes philippinarum]|uniref:uncharacterized protein LOC132758689 n=1 Tax=Ruditapes philippinarum TaxID=129788 RepID=UPI00295AA064|nr:uncharacterized protein LOC132758689 [Ruditapes philippinarum]